MKTRLIILLISIFTMLACASKKKVLITENKEIEKIEATKEASVFIVEENLPIKDTIVISLQTNDKKTDSVLVQKLQHFKASKKSGNNNFTASFDTINKAIKITASVQGSKKTVSENNLETTKKEKVIDKRVENVNHKRGLGFSWWWFLICVIIALTVSLFIYFKFFR